VIERPGTDVSTGGPPVEAPEWSPGHVGHSPQPLVSTLLRDRARNVLTSVLARVTPVEYAMQSFGPLHLPERRTQVSTLIAIEDFRRRQRAAQPWPTEYRDLIVGPAGRL
jgi:hypothetical protein